MKVGAVCALLVVALAGSGCRGDEAEASLSSYCEQARVLQQKGEEFFEDFNPQSQEEVEKAFVEFAKALQPSAEAALEVAPEEVHADLVAVVTALDRTAEGEVAAFTDPDAQAATRRLDQFEADECGSGGAGGEAPPATAAG